ncbi:ABC transporter permease [Afifella pfennigii]|uniref:ABC transporter permease n=1 Tax=Afifella pfennigii TaxID=209897 RepID=UPI0006899C23|nr:ABC transporter permease [Afifella pfennigii]
MQARYDPLLTRTARRALLGAAIAIFAFLYLPIAVLVVFSFSPSPLLVFPIEGLGLTWYRELFSDRDLWRSVGNSLIVTGTVVPLTLLLGMPLAFGLDRVNFPGKRLLEHGILLPLVVPGIVTGLALLLLLSRFDTRLSLFTVALGHSVWCLPIVVTQVYARLRRFDRSIEEASLDLGAGPATTFWRVTLPNLKSALLGSALLVFVLSFDEIPVTFFLTGSENTLPMHIWSMLREGVNPVINAIATLTIALSILVAFFGLRMLSRD